MRNRLPQVIVPVAIVGSVAASVFALVLATDGLAMDDALLVGLFAGLFSWIAFWCGLMLLGAWQIRTSRRSWGAHGNTATGASRPNAATSNDAALPRTAVLMPIYHEDVESLFERVGAMLDSLHQTGCGLAFDFFVLSDSVEPDFWLREELCWAALRQRRALSPSLFYRRRPTRFRKKSGNVADFCERWGGDYRYLIVLDADSIIDGSTLVELVKRMEAVPRLGILQAASYPALGSSLYARLQQFSAHVFGPPLFAGLAYVFQNDGNFWGHNAIIRTQPFMDHCGLPALSGSPPFGGPILSHDFVEAALMRRAGYAVRIAWDLLVGSYEQSPVSLANASVRDRRWCQGNLQHARLLLSPSFPVASRVHFAIGILFYVMSPLWGCFIVLYAANVLLADTTQRAFGWPLSAASAALLAATVILLFAGKVVGMSLVLFDRQRAESHGGRARFIISSGLEAVLSVLTAPILMLSHTICLASVLFGFSVDWTATERSASTSPWSGAIRAHAWQTATGVMIALATAFAAPTLFWWLSPVWLGLVLAVPLGAVLSDVRWGQRLRRHRLLLTPTETTPPAIIERLDTSPPCAARPQADFEARFNTLIRDPWLNALHRSLLMATGARSRPQSVVADLVQRVRKDGPGTLNQREALAVLSDSWAMGRLHELELQAPSAGRLRVPTA